MRARTSKTNAAEPGNDARWWTLFVAVGLALTSLWWLGPRGSGSSTPTVRSGPLDAKSRDLVSRPRAEREAPRAAVGARSAVSGVVRAVSGVVRSSDGRVLPGASVCACGASAEGCSLEGCSLEGSALPPCSRTDEHGRFALDDMPARADALAVSAVGHLSLRYLLPARAPASALEVTLERGGAEIAGVVMDASGGPVPEALVIIQPPGAAHPAAMLLADAEGRFRARVSGAELDVVARAESYSRAVRRVHAPAGGVILVLGPGAEIVGRVTREGTGEPLSGLTVVATAQGAPAEPISSSSSDAGGEFRLSGLRGGFYEVVAVGAEWRSAAQWVAVDAGQTSEALLLQASSATTLRGSVQVSGAPCGGAEVEVFGPAGHIARTAEDGSVQFDGLWPGSYSVEVRCPPALIHQEQLTLARAPVTRAWDLAPGLAVSGTITRASGQRVAGARVSVRPVGAPEGRTPSACASDEDGRFACAGLESGEYECALAGADEDASDAVRVVLAGAAVSGVLLRARPYGTLRVVLPPAGEDQRPFRVFARGESVFPIEGARQGDAFVFDGMPLGSYEVYVDLPSPGGPRAEALLERDGQTVELPLAAPTSASIEGYALDESGAPLVDAWVRAVPSDLLAAASAAAGEAPALTDDGGRFTLSALAPGTYDLHLRSRSGEATRSGVRSGAEGVVLRVDTHAAVPGDEAADDGAP